MFCVSSQSSMLILIHSFIPKLVKGTMIFSLSVNTISISIDNIFSSYQLRGSWMPKFWFSIVISLPLNSFSWIELWLVFLKFIKSVCKVVTYIKGSVSSIFYQINYSKLFIIDDGCLFFFSFLISFHFFSDFFNFSFHNSSV